MGPDINPYNVAVGQVWESCDTRGPKRTFQVVSVHGPRAVVRGRESNVQRTIRLDRFFTKKTKGYRKIS